MKIVVGFSSFRIFAQAKSTLFKKNKNIFHPYLRSDKSLTIFRCFLFFQKFASGHPCAIFKGRRVGLWALGFGSENTASATAIGLWALGFRLWVGNPDSTIEVIQRFNFQLLTFFFEPSSRSISVESMEIFSLPVARSPSLPRSQITDFATDMSMCVPGFPIRRHPAVRYRK
jgi:hypothetical protein